MNRYEIHAALRERRDTPPSPSTIYRVLRRYHLNRRTQAMREEKRRIIKDKLGELGHVDLHQLPRDMFLAPPLATACGVSLLDSCSRLAWAEVVTSRTALPVMFRTLKMINTLNVTYGLVLAEILSDNGAEFASRNRPDEHPFEAMLLELGTRHRYTRPDRPQTTDVVDKCFLAGSELFSSRAWVTARRRAGREAQALPRSLHRRTSVAAPVRTRLGPRGFQPETKRA
jgi:hypothetical protein